MSASEPFFNTSNPHWEALRKTLYVQLKVQGSMRDRAFARLMECMRSDDPAMQLLVAHFVNRWNARWNGGLFAHAVMEFAEDENCRIPAQLAHAGLSMWTPGRGWAPDLVTTVAPKLQPLDAATVISGKTEGMSPISPPLNGARQLYMSLDPEVRLDEGVITALDRLEHGVGRGAGRGSNTSLSTTLVL